MSEDDGTVSNVKSTILDLFTKLEESDLDDVEQWICSQSYRKDLEKARLLKTSESVFKKIGDAIKKIVPLKAEMPSENIVIPTVGEGADCNQVNTCHVDAFLYDDAQVEELVKDGIIKRQYCLDCNSKNVEDLIFISHSMSRSALQYVFKVLLPYDLEGKQLLDVGSRIGAVLYAANNLSNISTIVGVEINKECCDIQEKILDQFSMDRNRIKVIHSDVTQRSDIVKNSDIIVINVLDFFVDITKHKEMWYFFKKYIRKGCYIVTNRSMTDTLSCLGLNEELSNWLSICRPCQLENEILFDVDVLMDNEMFLYCVN